MNPLLKPLIIIIIACFPLPSAAFMCPKNFNQIDFGMSLDQVTDICGKPDSKKESFKPNENVPQEWSYFIPQTVGMNSFQQATGTLKSSVAFDDKGNAINISVNGIGVGATTICGTNVQLGDSRDTVKSACGTPAFINKQSTDASNGAPPDIKVNEFTYLSTPPVTLVFENGKLRDKK